MVLRALHLCSGYAGFELGLRCAGVPARTVGHVERDAYAAATLVARMADQVLDQAPVWSDLATFDGRPWRGRVDLITAGLPCQPFSSAGLGRGVDDERHLWPMAERIIADVRPRLVLLENVPDVVSPRYRWLESVLGAFAALGFDAEWGCLSAAAVGAPHKRTRFWLLAYTDRHMDDGNVSPVQSPLLIRADTDRGGEDVGDAGSVADSPGVECVDSGRFGVIEPASGRRRAGIDREGMDRWPPTRDDIEGWERWVAAGGPEPAVRRSSDGCPPGLADALHLGGNGLVPAVAGAALLELAARAGVDLI